jgi:hypothetical protein
VLIGQPTYRSTPTVLSIALPLATAAYCAMMAVMRVMAVDWSGKLKGEAEFIWLAEVKDGVLRTLENGRGRAEIIRHIVDLADDDPEFVVGFDFAFSFPEWWCRAQGWHSAREIWAAMTDTGEQLLDACDDPFWGRPEKRNPYAKDKLYRRTEIEDNQTAKSVFQIGGAGAVGTGSIRGMPHLRLLAEHGFSIWPFDSARLPLAIEIYPRALTGPVKKSRWAERSSLLRRRFPSQPPEMLERAAGSEDAFDAAVSALVMAEYEDQIAALAPVADAAFAIEGKVWTPR